MLRNLAYLEPEAYSKPWQKSMIKHFVKMTATIIYAHYNYCCDFSFLTLTTLWNEYYDFCVNSGLIFPSEVFILT